MMVKLLAKHIIGDSVHYADEIINVSAVTPLMEGLDSEAAAAIAQLKVDIFGRWIWTGHEWQLLDDPPIERPIWDPQPEPPIPQEGPGS
jgi:hypothetical protein